jgi:hypothetical protein
VVGNRNSKVYHMPNCPSVGRMSEWNRVQFGTVEEAVGRGTGRRGIAGEDCPVSLLGRSSSSRLIFSVHACSMSCVLFVSLSPVARALAMNLRVPTWMPRPDGGWSLIALR